MLEHDKIQLIPLDTSLAFEVLGAGPQDCEKDYEEFNDFIRSWMIYEYDWDVSRYSMVTKRGNILTLQPTEQSSLNGAGRRVLFGHNQANDCIQRCRFAVISQVA